MFRRMISIFISLVMLISLFPAEAFSEDYPETDAFPEEQQHEHSYASFVIEPTCTEQGYTVYTCECGASYADDYTDALNHPETVIVHGYNATCISTGLTDGLQCALCGEILTEQEEIAPCGHQPYDVAEVPATDYSAGTTAGSICSVCGEILAGMEEIPMLSPVPVPELLEEELPETESSVSIGQRKFAASAPTLADGEEPVSPENENDSETSNPADGTVPAQPPQNGWFEDAEGTYYYEDGNPVKGIYWIDGFYYYFYTSGIMLKSAEQSFYEDASNSFVTVRAKEDGRLYQNEWYQDEYGRDYYYEDNCHRVYERILQINGTWYAFGSYGYMLKNGASSVYNTSGNWIQVRAKEDGKLYQNEWYQDEYGRDYYYGDDCGMVSGKTMQFNGTWYGFDSNGIMLKNRSAYVYNTSGNYLQVRAKEDGKLYQNEWFEDEAGNRYYYGDDCGMISDQILQINGGWYGFDYYGVMQEDYPGYIIDDSGNGKNVRTKGNGNLYQKEWFEDTTGTRYYYGNDCGMISDQTLQIDGSWYGFNYNGTMRKNTTWSYYNESLERYISVRAKEDGKLYQNEWFEDAAGNRYYYGNDCGMIYNQKLQINGTWYGFDANGIMLKNTTLDYYDNSTGRRISLRAKKDGKLYQNEWFEDEACNRYYYGDDYGMIYNQTLQIDGSWYGFDYNGTMRKNTTWSYYNESLERSISVRAKEDGKLCQNEWFEDAAGNRCFYGDDCGMIYNQTLQIDGSWFRLGSNGVMLKNATLGYYDESLKRSVFVRAKEDGKLYHNEWFEDAARNRYYFGDDCGMISNQILQIDGSWYRFDSNGVMLKNAALEYYDNSTGRRIPLRAKEDGRLYQNEWFEDAAGNRYYYGDDCGMIFNQTLQIGGSWYGFNYNGIMAKNGTLMMNNSGRYIRAKEDGSLYINEWYKFVDNYGVFRWYYYGAEGYSLQGFQQVDGTDYFFINDGRMAKSVTVSGNDGFTYAVDSNGHAYRLEQNGWSKANGSWYYCIDGLALMSHVRMIEGIYYGFDGQGRMYTDTTGNLKYMYAENRLTFFQTHDDETEDIHCYHATASGALVTNTWIKVSDQRWFYFGADAKAYAGGIYTINGTQYEFDEMGISDGLAKGSAGWFRSSGYWYYNTNSGAKATGWQQISGKWYYFSSTGVMQTGWKQIGGKWFFLESSGTMATGWKQINNKWYYFNGSGAMQTGWLKNNGSWYYLEPSGAMLANTSRKIGSKTYYFNSSGVCTNP